MIDTMDEILQNRENLDDDQEISQPDLSDKIGETCENISQGTAKSYLSTYRHYLTEDEPFSRTTKPDGTAGRTTVFWSHDEVKNSGE